MPNINHWISTDRASDAWQRIQDKPSSIVIKRTNTPLPAQTVRLEFSNTNNETLGQGGSVVSVQQAVVFGVRNHPSEDVPDTNILKGDRFAAQGAQWRVVSVISQTGEVQATCEVTT